MRERAAGPARDREDEQTGQDREEHVLEDEPRVRVAARERPEEPAAENVRDGRRRVRTMLREVDAVDGQGEARSIPVV